MVSFAIQKLVSLTSFHFLIFVFFLLPWETGVFPGGSDGKASACNAGDPGSIPGLGRSPGEGNSNPFSTLAWRIPRTKEPGRLQSVGSQRVRHD